MLAIRHSVQVVVGTNFIDDNPKEWPSCLDSRTQRVRRKLLTTWHIWWDPRSIEIGKYNVVDSECTDVEVAYFDIMTLETDMMTSEDFESSLSKCINREKDQLNNGCKTTGRCWPSVSMPFLDRTLSSFFVALFLIQIHALSFHHIHA